MDLRILLLGIFFGLSAAVYLSLNSKEKQRPSGSERRRPPILIPNPPSIPIVPPQHNFDHPRIYPPRDVFRPRQPVWTSAFRRNNNRRRIFLVDNWQRSIMGLVELSKRNLEFAKKEFLINNCAGTIRLASASVENISRALIHCYGGKPDVHSGQIEALRLLLQRFTLEEKIQIEEIIGNMDLVYRYKKALKKATKNNFTICSVKKEYAKQVLELSTNIVKYFRSMLIDKFGDEIPLLKK